MDKEFKPFELAKRMENRILIGLAAITATIILVGWIAINENARMDEFTERSEGRSVEAGARIFENNCSACHGQDGRGTAGVAPALNNPVLFGYSFFGEIDSQITLLTAQKSASTDPVVREQYDTQIGELKAQRLALEEEILYGWSEHVSSLDEQLVALDEQIIQLEGVDNASRLTFYIEQRKANELAPLEQELADLEVKGAPVEEETPAEDDAATTEGDAATTDQATTEVTPTPEAEVTATAVPTETPTEVPTEVPTVEATAMTEGESPAEGEATVTEGATPAEAPAQEEPDPAIAVAEKFPLLTPEEVARYVELQTMIAAIEDELKPYEDLATERADLVAQRGRFQTVVDAQAEVEAARLPKAEIESQIAALGPVPTEEDAEDPNAAEREALTQQVIDLTKTFNEATSTRKEAYDALIEAGDILDYDPNGKSRLVEVGWAGSLRTFVTSTVTGGRPTSSAYWPQPMAAWGQVAGGPMRGDQINNVANFILNWQREFTVADVRAVRQFARVPSFGAGASADAPGTTDVAEIQATIVEKLDAEEITPGDPTVGQTLFADNGCAGCHAEQPAAGPQRTGLWTRVTDNVDNRLSLTGFEDDPEGYVIQSIVQPSAFVVPSFSDGIMPANFSERLGYQDLVNILAYLETLE